jgi:hypothetical protein
MIFRKGGIVKYGDRIIFGQSRNVINMWNNLAFFTVRTKEKTLSATRAVARVQVI